jgi:transcription elongation GreA/GreB family factor/transcription elongation factor GreA-like protein
MNNIDLLQDLKKEKKWIEIFNLFPDIPNKEKKTVSASKCFIDACENLRKFNNLYVEYLYFLANKSEHKSPYVNRLVEYYKDNDEKLYKEYYYRYLRTLAHEKSFNVLEDKFLELLENKDLIIPEEILEIANITYKKGNVDFASVIINLSLPYVNIDNDIYYYYLKSLIEFTTNDKCLRKQILEYFEYKYSNHKNYNRLIKVSKLQISENLSQSVDIFEDLIRFDEGEYVYHQNFKTGKIISVDFTFDDIKIEFENSVRKTFKRKNLKNILKHLPGDDIAVYRFDKIDEFKAIIDKEPDKAVYIILVFAKKQLTQKELKSFFVPDFIPEAEWNNRWKSIKEACEKSNIVDKDINHNYMIKSDRVISIVDEVLKITNIKKKLSELEKIQFDLGENDKNKIEDALKGVQSLRAQFLLLNLFPDKYNIELYIKNRIKSKERLYRFINDIIKINNIHKVLEISDELWPDFDEFMSKYLSEFTPLVEEQYIELLYKNKKNEIADNIINKSLNDIYLFPDLFLAICKNKLKNLWGGTKDIPVSRLIEKLFELYEYTSIEVLNEQDRDVKQIYQKLLQKTRDIIRADDFRNYRTAVNEIKESKRLKLLLNQISKIENMPIELQSMLRAIITDQYPDIENIKYEESESFYTLASSYDRMMKQYKHIISVEIPENSEHIYEAASMGDLSENAEYRAAKDKQKLLAGSLNTIRYELDRSIVIDLKDVNGDIVSFGTVVELEDQINKKIVIYKILGPWETDIQNNIISYKSEIGRELEEKKKGDVIQFKNNSYLIINIKKLEMI